MSLINFQEYLSSKGVLQDKPKVKIVADEVDIPSGRDIKPPKSQGMSNDHQPYSTNGKGVSSNEKSKGFGDQGCNDLKIDITKTPKTVKIPTATEWNLATEVSESILVNPKMLEHLVNELRKNNLLGPLVAELTDYKETFNHLSEIMANKVYGPVVCDRFAKSLKENVAPPFGDNDDEEDEEMDDLADFEGEDQDDEFGDEMPEDDSPIDEEPPSDRDLEPGLDGMGQKPRRNDQKPMSRALEHLNYSLRKDFI